MTIAIGVSMAVASVFVACSKKQTAQPASAGTTQNPTAARDYEVPANPQNPPPLSYLEGPEICFSQTCQAIELGFGVGPCDEDNGYICNWSSLPCEESNAAMALPHAFDELNTGVVYVKIRLTKTGSLSDVSGTALVAHSNIRLDDNFAKALNCEAAFLLQGEYSYIEGNIAVVPLYIVNHTR